MDLYTLTETDILKNANDVKDLVLQTLEDLGYITSAQEVGENIVVVVFRKGWLGKFFDKLMNTEATGIKMQCFRVIHRPFTKGHPMTTNESKF